MLFGGILVVFRLDLGQISLSLVENAFATPQLALLASKIVSLDILGSGVHRNQNFVTYAIRL